MIKKLLLLLISLITIISSCKEDGQPFIKWRNYTAQNMINRYNAIAEIRAMKDTVLMKGITQAIIEINLTYRDTNIKFVKIGFCYSATNPKPILKESYNPLDSLENYSYLDIQNSTMDTLGGKIGPYSKTATLNFGLSPLKIDQSYYARSFVVYEYTNTGKKDTAYNSVVSTFRTRVPEDYWFHKPSFPSLARTEAVSFVVKNIAFIGCGYSGLSLLKDFWKYDPHGGVGGNGSWENIASPGTNFEPRRSAVAITWLNDTVLIGLGIVDETTKKPSSYFRKLAINFVGDEYNWSTPQVDTFPSPRYDAVGFSLSVLNPVTQQFEPRAYICGGTSGNNQVFNDLQYYDYLADHHGLGSSNAWKAISTYGGGNGGNITEAVVAIINNVAIIGSGRDANGPKNSFYKYDPNSGTSGIGQWGAISIFPGTPRANAVALTLEYTKKGVQYKHIFFGTGRTQSGEYLNDWWLYDFNQEKWTQKSDIIDYTNPNKPDTANAREGAIAFSIKKLHVAYGTLERGFVGLGQKKGSPNPVRLNDFWEYLP